MRVEQSIDIAAPAAEIWTTLGDPTTYPSFFQGVTRWEHAGGRKTGRGARYAVRMHVGNAHVGGTIEIVEFLPRSELAWVGITGIDQRGRWRLRESDDGTTNVTVRLIYDSPGGIVGQLADFVSAPMVSRNLRASLQALRQQVEAGTAA